MDIERDRVIGKTLKMLRQERGLTQCEVAHYLGRNQSIISKLEMGERALPLIETWFYAEALGVEPALLIQLSYEALSAEGLEPQEPGICRGTSHKLLDS